MKTVLLFFLLCMPLFAQTNASLVGLKTVEFQIRDKSQVLSEETERSLSVDIRLKLKTAGISIDNLSGQLPVLFLVVENIDMGLFTYRFVRLRIEEDVMPSSGTGRSKNYKIPAITYSDGQIVADYAERNLVNVAHGLLTNFLDHYLRLN